MDRKLLSYTAIDGISTFTDSFVRGLFERMQDEDLVKVVFCDGSVRTSEDFLRIMKHGMNSLFVIDLDGKPGGCVWLNGFEKRKADFHFCFFSNLRGADAIEVGKRVVLELLNMTDGGGSAFFDLLVGVVSERNLPALRWCKRMEFETLGVLPSALYDAEAGQSVAGHIFYVERGSYGKGR